MLCLLPVVEKNDKDLGIIREELSHLLNTANYNSTNTIMQFISAALEFTSRGP